MVTIDVRQVFIDQSNRCGRLTHRCSFMANTVAQVTMINHELVEALQIDPKFLPETIIHVTGISGDGFQRKNWILHLQVIHMETNESTIERVLVQPQCTNIMP